MSLRGGEGVNRLEETEVQPKGELGPLVWIVDLVIGLWWTYG